MLGILSLPLLPATTAVLIIVGGPQYRVGSHRQFVQLARHLAKQGFAVLRFDYRGMGDSEGEIRAFDTIDADVGIALEALIKQGQGAIESVVLWGLCDGATAALLHWHTYRNPKITGMVLLNPWVRTEEGLALTQVKHYYTQRLTESEFWLKLISGKVAFGALRELAKKSLITILRTKQIDNSIANPSFQQKVSNAIFEFPGWVMLVLSGRDLTAQEFIDYCKKNKLWQHSLRTEKIQRVDLPTADHTFSDLENRLKIESLTLYKLMSQPASYQINP